MHVHVPPEQTPIAPWVMHISMHMSSLHEPDPLDELPVKPLDETPLPVKPPPTPPVPAAVPPVPVGVPPVPPAPPMGLPLVPVGLPDVEVFVPVDVTLVVG